jgi:hypothetical protein
MVTTGKREPGFTSKTMIGDGIEFVRLKMLPGVKQKPGFGLVVLIGVKEQVGSPVGRCYQDINKYQALV